MPKYKCTYAYDVPHYFDFTVDAENEAQAEKLIEKALADSAFEAHTAKACANYENQHNDRVFVSERLGPDDEPDAYQLDNGEIVG